MIKLNLKSCPRTSGRLRRIAAVLGCLVMFAQLSVVGAQETEKALKVHMNSGDPQFFILSSEPVITFEGTECVIKSSEFSARYDMGDIYFAEFVDHTTAIDEEMKEALTVDLSDPNAIVIRGMNAGGPVALYNLSGVFMLGTVADSEGTAVLDISSLPAAVYIVTSKETSFKIYRK